MTITATAEAVGTTAAEAAETASSAGARTALQPERETLFSQRAEQNRAEMTKIRRRAEPQAAMVISPA